MTHDEPDVEIFEDVDWQVDEDGTEFFVHEGQRYELADDGYAYAVEEPEAADDEVGPAAEAPEVAGDVEVADVADDTATTELPRLSRFSRDGEAASPAAHTDVLPGGRGTANGHASPNGDLLRLEGVTSGYGQRPVLHGVDLAVGEGQTAVLLGLNGAGKTTTALNVCGSLKTWSGSITYDGQDISGWSVKKCVNHGIVLVPEGRRVFPDLSVARNLQIGSWVQRKDNDWIAEQQERVLGYFPRLRERLTQLAGTLSGGEQQMLAIARGLMARPRLLIIDEASMGLAPVIVKSVFEIVRQINRDGVTVLMIEQNVGALEVADLGAVMEQGRVIRALRGDDLRDRSVVSQVLMG